MRERAAVTAASKRLENKEARGQRGCICKLCVVSARQQIRMERSNCHINMKCYVCGTDLPVWSDQAEAASGMSCSRRTMCFLSDRLMCAGDVCAERVMFALGDRRTSM